MNLVHFSLKIWHLVVTTLVIFRWGDFSKVAFLAVCEIVRSSKRGAGPKRPSGKYAYVFCCCNVREKTRPLPLLLLLLLLLVMYLLYVWMSQPVMKVMIVKMKGWKMMRAMTMMTLMPTVSLTLVWDCLSMSPNATRLFHQCFSTVILLSLWLQLLPYGCQTGLSRSFVIFGIRELWRSALSTRVPGRQKLQMTGLTRSGTGCFIAVPVWQLFVTATRTKTEL